MVKSKSVIHAFYHGELIIHKHCIKCKQKYWLCHFVVLYGGYNISVFFLLVVFTFIFQRLFVKAIAAALAVLLILNFFLLLVKLRDVKYSQLYVHNKSMGTFHIGFIVQKSVLHCMDEKV